MKKSLITFLIAITAIYSYAQESPFYISLYGGMGVDIAPGKYVLRNDLITANSTNDSVVDLATFKEVDHNFGKGARLGVTLGARLVNSAPGICFQVSVFKKFKSSLEFESYQNERYYDYMTFFVNQLYREKYTASALFINPALVFRSETGKIRPYMKLGALIMFSSIDGEVTYSGSTNYPNNYPTFGAYQKFEFDTDPSLGVDFGLGTSLTLTDGLSAFGEIDFQYIKTWPTKRRIVEYTEQGVDKLSTLTVSQKETEFVEEYSTDWNEDPDQPSKDVRHYATFNSLAINVGIMYNF